jgi:AMP deaminase
MINQIRASRHLNTFAFRPHSGEAGSIDHLASAYLTSHSINHGIELQNSPVLQYLFYLKQIGLSMSPLSNNKLFLKFLNNPFLKFFERGLNVTLSTDDPLMIHLTREPLIEEYSVVAQALELNTVSLCEIARNSVLQSGFSFERKTKWLGNDFMDGGPYSNDTNKTSLSWIRYAYRYEAFTEEIDYIRRHAERLYV